MPSEIEIIKARIDSAMTAEDFFGNITGSKEEIFRSLRSTFAMLFKVVHPDRNPLDRKNAEEASAALTEIYRAAKMCVAINQWGNRVPLHPVESVIIAGKYERFKLFAVGDIADVHLGKYDGKAVLIKVARFSADNDLLLAEKNSIEAVRTKLKSKPNGHVLLAGLPQVLDSLLITDGKTIKRRVNVIEAFPGFYTAEQVVNLIGWVDERTLAWMWSRMLVFLDWVYRAGVIHGAILPKHVLFYPDNDGNTKDIDMRKHALRLVGWGHSIQHENRTRLSSWVPSARDFYSPEIIKKDKLGPSTDLYMAAKTMIYLSGGDVMAGTVGKQIQKPIADSLLACIDPDPSKRPSDPTKHFKNFTVVRDEVFGRPKWHDFHLPGGPATTMNL